MKRAGFPHNLEEVWERHFGFVSGANGQQIVVGETGGTFEGRDREWQEAAIDYYVRKGIGIFYFGLQVIPP